MLQRTIRCAKCGPMAFLAMALLLAPMDSAAQAQTIWEGFESGDLVFIERTGPLATFLKSASGMRLNHVGIMRNTGGGPYILDSTPEEGVFEHPVDEFVMSGVGGHYSVYRFNGLPKPADENHPAIKMAYANHYLKPYDPFFRPGTDALHDGELIRVSFADAGASIGTPRTLRALGADSPEGRAVFLANWRAHPDCKAKALDKAACWQLILDQEIVTPASIANDPQVTRVFTTLERAEEPR